MIKFVERTITKTYFDMSNRDALIGMPIKVDGTNALFYRLMDDQMEYAFVGGLNILEYNNTHEVYSIDVEDYSDYKILYEFDLKDITEDLIEGNWESFSLKDVLLIEDKSKSLSRYALVLDNVKDSDGIYYLYVENQYMLEEEYLYRHQLGADLRVYKIVFKERS